MRRIKLTVSPSDEGERLDRFLAAQGGVSRGEARRALERGGVYLEGARVKVASRLLRAGQKVELVLEEAGRVQQAPPAPLKIIHEDDDVLAVDKAAGVASQATLSGDVGTLPWLVAKHLGVKLADVATVHRLDLNTSGVVVFGKNKAATTALTGAFREGKARKEYVAIAAGRLEGEGRLEAPLAPNPARKGSFQVDPRGIPAITEWKAVAWLDDVATVVSLFPETGRTHQLRAHLAHLGHPIVGDSRYGGPSAAGPIKPPRFLLHARALALPHPRGGTLALEAPLPADFREALDHVGNALFP